MQIVDILQLAGASDVFRNESGLTPSDVAKCLARDGLVHTFEEGRKWSKLVRCAYHLRRRCVINVMMNLAKIVSRSRTMWVSAFNTIWILCVLIKRVSVVDSSRIVDTDSVVSDGSISPRGTTGIDGNTGIVYTDSASNTSIDSLTTDNECIDTIDINTADVKRGVTVDTEV